MLVCLSIVMFLTVVDQVSFCGQWKLVSVLEKETWSPSVKNFVALIVLVTTIDQRTRNFHSAEIGVHALAKETQDQLDSYKAEVSQ